MHLRYSTAAAPDNLGFEITEPGPPAHAGRPVAALFGALAAVLAAALLLLPAPASAQGDAPTGRADTAVRDTPAIPLDPITVTVSKLPIRPSRAGFAVDVVPEVTLQGDRPRYAMEALRELPGAFIDEATGPGGPSIVRLRGGEEVFTQILMDGVQVNENGGFFDFQGVTLTNVGRVEVARGPQSALYGSSAVSGVVHFLTPAGQPGPLRLGGVLEGGGDVGNGRSFRSSVVARGGSDALLYSAGAGLAYNRGIYALPHDTWTRDGSLRLDASPTDRVQVTATARYIGIDTHHPVRDPGVTRVPLDPNARLERDRYVASARAHYQASARWTHTLTAEGFRHDFTYFDQRDDIQQPADFFVVDADLTATNDVRRVAGEYLARYAAGPNPATAPFGLALGARWEREDLHTGLTGDFGDAEADFDRRSLAAFADLHGHPHPRIDLLLGARAEHYEGVGTAVTPRGSIVFRVLPDRLSLRAAAGRAYKAPNLRVQFQDDPFIAPNPELQPETSVSVEVGADLHVSRELRISATTFHQDYHGLIRTVPLENGTRLQSRNVGESRAWGIEGSARYQIRPGTWIGLDGARTWTEVLDNTGLSPEQYPVGGPLPFRPRFTANAHVHTGLAARIEARAVASYVGPQVVLTERFSGQRATIDGYLRVDGTVQYQLADRQSLYVRISNLFDTPYLTAFDRPGIPFSATLGYAVDP